MVFLNGTDGDFDDFDWMVLFNGTDGVADAIMTKFPLTIRCSKVSIARI